jgi:hypothetical protein
VDAFRNGAWRVVMPTRILPFNFAIPVASINSGFFNGIGRKQTFLTCKKAVPSNTLAI